MSRIKIKNFGPIKEGFIDNDGWLDIKKVTLFTGNQGSGKSTVAKLISTFIWVEKALTRGDFDAKTLYQDRVFVEELFAYHRIQNYFHGGDGKSTTLIDYKGDSFCIRYENDQFHIEEATSADYPLPQIMYVPAERNFISNVKNATSQRLISAALNEFATEYSRALEDLKNPLLLPINEVKVEYRKTSNMVYVKGADYRIELAEASSGFQSLVPLYIVSRNLATSIMRQNSHAQPLMTPEQRERFRKRLETMINESGLTEEQRRILISEEARKFNKAAFINIVEEPEQNLFPISQWELLKVLLALNNFPKRNLLIMTTHSPYLINYLTIVVKAYSILQNIEQTSIRKKIDLIVPENSTLSADDLAIYEMDERTGSIQRLEQPNSIPSDENQLNTELSHTNELYARLLDIQQSL